MIETYLQIAVSNQIPQDQLRYRHLLRWWIRHMRDKTAVDTTTVQNFKGCSVRRDTIRCHRFTSVICGASDQLPYHHGSEGRSQRNGYSPAMFQQILSGDRVLATRPLTSSNSSNSYHRSPRRMISGYGRRQVLLSIPVPDESV